MLIVISGLPGTGKSAIATLVAEQLSAVHLSIDVIEDALLGAGLERSWTTGVVAYEAVRAVAEQNLLLGRTVVVDAVNDSELARETWRAASAHTHAPLVFVLLTVDDEGEHRRRLEGRSRSLSNIPEPSWDEVSARAAAFAPWAGECVRVSADGRLDDVAAAVFRGLAGARPADS